MNDRSNRLFEVAACAEPFEEPGLRQQTDFQARAARAGADFKDMAVRWLSDAGADIERTDFEIDEIPVDAQVRGSNGRAFLVIIRGTPYEGQQSGFRRTDTLEKAGFRAMNLARCQPLPILLVTSDLPERDTKPGHYLALLDRDVWDVVAYRADLRGFHRLRMIFAGPLESAPPMAPWRAPATAPEPQLFDSDGEPTRHAVRTDDRAASSPPGD